MIFTHNDGKSLLVYANEYNSVELIEPDDYSIHEADNASITSGYTNSFTALVKRHMTDKYASQPCAYTAAMVFKDELIAIAKHYELDITKMSHFVVRLGNEMVQIADTDIYIDDSEVSTLNCSTALVYLTSIKDLIPGITKARTRKLMLEHLENDLPQTNPPFIKVFKFKKGR